MIFILKITGKWKGPIFGGITHQVWGLQSRQSVCCCCLHDLNEYHVLPS